jgi:hypothetical protein
LENKRRNKKLRIYNITTKAAFKYGGEAWVLKKREEQRSEEVTDEIFETLTRNNKIR